MSARAEILREVQAARPPAPGQLPAARPPEEAEGYRQALRADLLGQFARRAEELGVQVHRLPEGEGLVAWLAELCSGRPTYVEPALGELAEALRARGVPLVGWEQRAEAEVGVTGADYGIAESGSLVWRAAPDRPRAGSLLPPVHVALLGADRILADLFELFDRVDPLPTALTLATGPSRSADIEMSLAVGVHGPGVVHVVLVRRQEQTSGPTK